ncbi:MAG: alanine racemase [Eubacteriales bacterium]|nr:alanine racemase [Eubacteriales bacterium]
MYCNSHLRRSWVEIDLEQIVKNYWCYKNSVKAKEIMAVIKADAYGHGDIEIARILQKECVRLFVVSNIEEAAGLRKAGITGEILILGYTPAECSDQLVQYNLTQAILDENYAEIMADKGIKAQFAIDTGMNRIGLDADQPLYCEKIFKKYYNRFIMNGIFTHLCVADIDTNESNNFTTTQIQKFYEVSKRVSDLNMPYVHCMNSAGGLLHGTSEGIGEIVRLGILLYGLKPDYKNSIPEEIKPALTWKSVVSMVKSVHPGESIGYGRTFIAEREMKVATIPTGYADGYRRELSNKGKVEINGMIASIVGRICMDQIMVDVSEIEVHPGDEVFLIGNHYSADDLAQDVETIGYEIVCGISKRVPRIYIHKTA